MKINSRLYSVIMALAIAVVTTAFLYLVPGADRTTAAVVFSISFLATLIFSTITIEILVFREVRKVYRVLERLKEGSKIISPKTKLDFNNPFRSINKELFTYASIKQREIEDLRKLETFRREFLADVSHELKTPIFAAQGYLHTLLDGAVEDKTVRLKFLRRAARSLDRLDTLVQDLLTLSQIETGAIKMHNENFDVVETVVEVVDQLEEKAERKKIKVEFGSAFEDPIMVYADPEKIYRVILNLVSNAIKYTKDGGKVIIDFEEGKNDVTVFVKDTGRGIPPEDIKRIFERFYRVEKSRSKEKGGTGLGLAIVKHIIEAHNSKVTVTSVVGKGSVFGFKLKRSQVVNVNEVHS
jgi:two-component system, OmpR family, phosphate regulon sensor histidine kinase PhoR